ncbi:MAG: hypothetical protein H6594_02715 [Flavobacteriales bacterium]|nr:hypothetical protein [Flavobacteriales bacterium]
MNGRRPFPTSVTFASTPYAVPGPRLITMFSLFRTRGPRGFDYTPRYYDAEKERRAERDARIKAELDDTPREATYDRERFAARMRHSWQRERSGGSYVARLALVLGGVLAFLWAMYRFYLHTAA